MGRAVFPLCCLTWDQTMVEVMKMMVTSFKRSHACTDALSAPTLQQATADPCLRWRLLNTHGEIWVSLLWGHCSFLLGHGAHKVLFVLSKSLFPESCESPGGSMVGLMATPSKRAYATPRSVAPRAPAPAAVPCWLVPPQETLKHSSGSVSVGSLGLDMHGVFGPSEHLWWVWGLILNAILPLLPSCWSFSFAFGCGVSFFFWWDPTFYCRRLFSSEL